MASTLSISTINRARFTLATLLTESGQHAALGIGNNFYLLSDLQPLLSKTTTKDIFSNWSTSFPLLQHIAHSINAASLPESCMSPIPAATAHLLTPILYPNKLIGVGANYSGHLKEMGLSAQKWPSMPFFLRPPTTTLVGPGPSVTAPSSTREFDWECELAVVVGCKLRHASVGEVIARGGIAGYSIGLDMSCRDLIVAPNELKIDLVRGKAQDGMAPCGPVVVPAQFLDNGRGMKDAGIKLWVNGKLMMDARTSEMLYSVEEQLSIISDYVTLEPGDVLFTGSPSGSAGVHGGCWLKKGDEIRAEIEEVGVLEVSIVEE